MQVSPILLRGIISVLNSFYSQKKSYVNIIAHFGIMTFGKEFFEPQPFGIMTLFVLLMLTARLNVNFDTCYTIS